MFSLVPGLPATKGSGGVLTPRARARGKVWESGRPAAGAAAMKARIAHTHLNVAFGKRRDEPIFIVVPGAKEDCAECRTRGQAEANRPVLRRDRPVRKRVP